MKIKNQANPQPFGAINRWDLNPSVKRLYHAFPWYIQNLLMSGYGLLVRKRITGSMVQGNLSKLLESQWHSKDELVVMQTHKLRRLIDHAYVNVPYYRQIFDNLGLKPRDVQELSDLKKLPLLGKNELRRHFKDLTARNVDLKKLNLRITSGTTGKPLQVYLSSEAEYLERALSFRLRHWAGWKAGESLATLTGMMVVPMDHRGPPYWRYDIPEKRLFFSVYHMTADNIPQYLEKLSAFGPKAIETYPSYIYFLAKHLERMGETIPVDAVFTVAETLYPHQRRIIEERFQCKVFDWYGLTERVASASQCEYTDGYHLSSEKVIVEIIKPDGEPAYPGEYGEIVGTNLEEFGMPLIRYRTGDMSAYRVEPCPCGRGLPLIEHMETRVDDIITAPDGRLINPAPLAGLFRTITIEKARIIQEERDRILVMIMPGEGYLDSEAEPIVNGIRTVLGQEVKIAVQLVDDIPCTANGKYPFIVSKVPLEV